MKSATSSRLPQGGDGSNSMIITPTTLDSTWTKDGGYKYQFFLPNSGDLVCKIRLNLLFLFFIYF